MIELAHDRREGGPCLAEGPESKGRTADKVVSAPTVQMRKTLAQKEMVQGHRWDLPKVQFQLYTLRAAGKRGWDLIEPYVLASSRPGCRNIRVPFPSAVVSEPTWASRKRAEGDGWIKHPGFR